MTDKLTHTQSLSKFPFIIIGCMQAVLLALISLNTEIFTEDRLFFTRTLVINFGLIFLLASNAEVIVKLIVSSLIYSLLASMIIYYLFKNNNNFNILWLSFFAIHISAAFLQTKFKTRSINVFNHYATLFEKSWDLFCILFCMTFFCLLAWLILLIGTYLCSSIGIYYFNDFISNPAFISFITPLMAVTSLYLLQSHQNIIYFMRIVLINFCLVLLPILSLIGIVYLMALLFQLINNNLDFNKITNYWLVSFIGLGIIFINAVYQDGQKQIKIKYYSWAVLTLSVLMLLFSIQNLFLLFHKQTTLTAFNVVSFIAGALFLIYSFFYTFSSLNLIYQRSKLFENTNIVLALIITLIVLIIQNPFTRSSAFFSNLSDSSVYPVYAETPQVYKSDISKANLTWSKNIKSNLILGYRDNSPIYACRASITYEQKAATIPGEINSLGECIFILEKKILNTKNYTVINGKDKNISWQQFYNYGDSKLFPINFGSDDQKQLNICRGIYANKIYLGQMRQYEYRCQIVYENSIQELRTFEVLYAAV